MDSSNQDLSDEKERRQNFKGKLKVLSQTDIEENDDNQMLMENEDTHVDQLDLRSKENKMKSPTTESEGNNYYNYGMVDMKDLQRQTEKNKT